MWGINWLRELKQSGEKKLLGKKKDIESNIEDNVLKERTSDM